MTLDIKSLVAIPKMQLAICLGLILLSALFRTFLVEALITVLIAVLGCLVSEYLFWKIRKIPVFLPSAAVVTGLIIGLLASPSLPWYTVIAFAILAIASKNFLRIGGKHIFNPASAGLFLGGVLFQQPVSWWGVSFQTFNLTLSSLVFFIILIFPAWVSVIKMKRYRIILSFLIIYGIIYLSRLGWANVGELTTLRAAFLDPTTLFFALVMLPEPRTSPNQFKWQFLFGVSVALLSFVFSLPFWSSLGFLVIPDPFIAALLVANIVFFNK